MLFDNFFNHKYNRPEGGGWEEEWYSETRRQRGEKKQR